METIDDKLKHISAVILAETCGAKIGLSNSKRNLRN